MASESEGAQRTWGYSYFYSQTINPATARCSAAECTVAGTLDSVGGCNAAEAWALAATTAGDAAGTNDRFHVCGMGKIIEPNDAGAHCGL
jgi:hypothetical protein